jgi:hypothetical protein
MESEYGSLHVLPLINKQLQPLPIIELSVRIPELILETMYVAPDSVESV